MSKTWKTTAFHSNLRRPGALGQAGTGLVRANLHVRGRTQPTSHYRAHRHTHKYSTDPLRGGHFLELGLRWKKMNLESTKRKTTTKTGQQRLTLKYPEQFIASKVNTFSFPKDLSFPSFVCTLLKGKYLFRNYNRKNKDPPLLPPQWLSCPINISF